MDKDQWMEILNRSKKPKGLGEYLNKEFKPGFEKTKEVIIMN